MGHFFTFFPWKYVRFERNIPQFALLLYSVIFLLAGTQGKNDEKYAKISQSKYCDTWYFSKRKNVS